MSVTIRLMEPADRATFADLHNAVMPDWGTSVAELEWSARTYPGGIRLIGSLDGRPVGAVTAGRIYIHPPEHPYWWAEVTVLPAARNLGVGTALMAEASREARAAGKRGFTMPASEARPEGVAWLERRGYTVLDREKMVRLELAGVPSEPDPPPPAGIRLVTLAERPDLIAAIHAVAVEAFADIPGEDRMEAGDLDEFRKRDVERPGIEPEGFIVALDGEEVVGYGSMIIELGRPTVAIHDMTAVRPAWRGRGIATAIKRATVAWARARGLEALETGNDEDNAAMRAVNARLGFQPTPDVLMMRGPLLDRPDPAAPAAS